MDESRNNRDIARNRELFRGFFGPGVHPEEWKKVKEYKYMFEPNNAKWKYQSK